MSGRLTQFAVRVFDRLGRTVPASPQPAEHLATGVQGEEAAYFHLRKLDYVMVARNWRSPRHRGELDLVAWDGDVLCFVEVKTRTTREVKPAEAAVDGQKRHDLQAVARDYLRRLTPRPACRFDIVSIYLGGESVPPEITLFKNAFPMSYY